MGLTKKHFKIAEILAALFTGSQTEKDQREFDEWVKERENNKVFADKLLDPNRYEENRRALRKFQAKEVWNKIDARLGEPTKKIPLWKNVVRYAAVVLVLLSVGVYFWLDRSGVKEITPVMYQISAGTTGARLILGDGSTVDIIKDRTIELEEADGTTIVTDSAGIDYSAITAKDTAEIRNIVQTLTGMEYTLTLSDGTKVFLNAETKLKFPTIFKGDQRVVELEGEAYFEVRKDEAHPFIVKTVSMNVRVLGTSFNVRSYVNEHDVTATLVEGKVAVSDGEVEKMLVPGEQAVYIKETGKMEVKEVDVSLYTAWHSGKFIFRNETLEDMMIYLSRWYGFKYRFIDDQAKRVQLGARLDRYDNMNPIVEMLRKTGLVNVTQVDDMLYISSAK
ncbi:MULTISPECIES: FecR family protein [Odoribacteraceae]|uniref:FecR family protein n=1 Tax=Odoribacteraceae TaxID=1853231 RepID=UPI000E49E67E|nr:MULTISPECIES: FecR domain-containing protein [Odoribacteraceae]MCQ4873579.1 FecR domain-containing protein [Butyricimonas paravirosa]RHR76743.1 DUF4974 domain-containing protein [Odoribacter sp. AF15-53]